MSTGSALHRGNSLPVQQSLDDPSLQHSSDYPDGGKVHGESKVWMEERGKGIDRQIDVVIVMKAGSPVLFQLEAVSCW